MNEEPIWQSAVKANCNGERALGRVFVQGDDIYYFPEIPRRRNWLWRGLIPSVLGGFLSLVALCSAMGGQLNSVYVSTWENIGFEMALFGGLFFLLTGAIVFGFELWNNRISKDFLEDDEHIGMSLEERFSVSPKAIHFKRQDIDEIKGDERVTIKTQLGHVLQLQTLPQDKGLVKRLQGETYTERLPKEAIANEQEAGPKRERPRSTTTE